MTAIRRILIVSSSAVLLWVSLVSGGQVVMKITAGASTLSYHSLWLNGRDRLFETLAAEENLFKDIEISGLLREYLPTMGIVDLPTVQVIGEEAGVP